MKKKIGDFTLRELEDICNSKIDCSECPLYNCRRHIGDIANLPPEYLEKEIEIDGEEKKKRKDKIVSIIIKL